MKVEYEGHEQLTIMLNATNYNDTLFSFISQGVSKTDEILDFGAGLGLFANRFSNQERIHALEIDSAQLALINTQNKYSCLDEIDDNSFDVIYSLNVLEHIKDDKDVIKQLSSHLKSGGEFRVFVPAKMLLYSSMDRAVGHVRRYEKKELLTLFEMHGLKVVHCSYFDFLGFFAALLYKYIGSKEGEITKRSILFYDRIIFPVSRFFDYMTFGKLLGKNLMITVKKD